MGLASTAETDALQAALTTSVSGQGTITLDPPDGTYNSGTSVTLAATPDAGWRFDHWTGDLSGNANPATISMDADKSVTAFFIQQFTLTTSVTGQGEVSLDSPGGAYDSGAPVSATATPASGWRFDHWDGDLSGTTNPATLTMDADKNVSAVFIQQFTLTTSVTGQGSVSLDPAGGTYDTGASVMLTATPASGWSFDYWSGDVSGSDNPLSLTMDANKTATAVFSTSLPEMISVPAGPFTMGRRGDGDDAAGAATELPRHTVNLS